ncbi:MAG: hypothetical protein OEV00_12375, partial [Acidobacteriota bacterium]|nr:hypothetical protein [Acidobacteriota bacterium]
VVGLQLLLLAAAITCLRPLGRQLFDDDRVGLVAVGLALLYGPFAFHGLKLLPVTLALGTQVALLSLLLRAGLQPTWMRLGLAGLAAGVAAITRVEALLLLILVLATLVLLRPRRLSLGQAGIVLITTLLVIAPITYHNVSNGDRVLIASSSGENLFIGNQRGADGGHTPLDTQAGDIESQRILARRIAEQSRGRALLSSEVSRYWATRAVDEIREAPAAWLGIEARKLRRALVDADPTDLYSLRVERRRYLGWLYLFVVPTSVLVVGAIYGGVCLLRRRGFGQAMPIVAMILGHLCVLLTFFVSTRLRLPMLFFLCPLAAYAVVGAIDDRREPGSRRRGTIVLLVGALLVLASPFAGQVTERETLRLASVLSRQDRLDESLDVLSPLVASAEAGEAVFDQACWVAFKQEDWRTAGEHCREALKRGIDGNRACAVRTRLGWIDERLGALEQAGRWHDEAVAEGCPTQALMERALYRARRGDRRGAVADLRTVLTREPGSRVARQWLERLGGGN